MSSQLSPDSTPGERLPAQESSHATGIADASAIKDGGLFFLCRRDGSVPLEGGHGLGLYFRDCRFLSGYELRLAGAFLEPLAANDEDGFRAVFQLANPNLGPPGEAIVRHRLGARWRHVIDADEGALRDELTLENYDTNPHAFPLHLAFAADFRDVFLVRALADQRPGAPRDPRWEDGTLVFGYDGGDGCRRELHVRFSEPPSRRSGSHVEFDVQLEPHEAHTLIVAFSVVAGAGGRAPRAAARKVELSVVERGTERSTDDWMKGFTRVRSTSLSLERAVARSLRDLRALRMSLDDNSFFAAGVPWYATLLGRDSLICALQTLAYRPEIAAETLRLLARFQGRRADRWREEEPGKILHELRVGELARMGKIPHTPYYGTVDATPLFLILLGEYVKWSGDLSLFEELGQAAEAALAWMDRFGDHDGDGYLDYSAEPGQALVNQGWKDSGGAIVDSTGRRAERPIALCEVQGYAYRARQEMAALFRRSGDGARAQPLERDAAVLRERFNRDFWLEDRGFYALALERGGHRIDSVASNAGHALWTGIVDDARAGDVVNRLMADDMYSGWGVRTLSSSEGAYNPIGYHLGTVWPHDNSLIAAGFRRYGRDLEACKIFSGLIQASTYFGDDRLPELFAGYPRMQYDPPVRYPVACHPQAWASGSIPFLLQVLLGLEPDALEKRLCIVRPRLPDFVSRVVVEQMRIGGALVDLSFEGTRGGELTVRVERLEGELEILVQPAIGPSYRARG